jgi:hypothetical protein
LFIDEGLIWGIDLGGAVFLSVTRRALLAFMAVVLLTPTLAPRAGADIKAPFLGVWDEIDATNKKGDVETGHAGMRRIFTSWGYYSITLAGEGRNVVKKPVEEMTEEELLNRFASVITQDGTFDISGPNQFTAHRRVSESPQNHGTTQVMQWKIENGELYLTILSDTGAAPVGQTTRYKRMNR